MSGAVLIGTLQRNMRYELDETICGLYYQVVPSSDRLLFYGNVKIYEGFHPMLGFCWHTFWHFVFVLAGFLEFLIWQEME